VPTFCNFGYLNRVAGSGLNNLNLVIFNLTLALFYLENKNKNKKPALLKKPFWSSLSACCLIFCLCTFALTFVINPWMLTLSLCLKPFP
jgi:hypothetical protein